MYKLHLFGGGEAQQADAGFQHVFRKADEGNVARLDGFVLLLEDGGLVVELVDAACQLIDVGGRQGRQPMRYGRGWLSYNLWAPRPAMPSNVVNCPLVDN